LQSEHAKRVLQASPPIAALTPDHLRAKPEHRRQGAAMALAAQRFYFCGHCKSGRITKVLNRKKTAYKQKILFKINFLLKRKF
jgi:hypothetical protein